MLGTLQVTHIIETGHIRLWKSATSSAATVITSQCSTVDWHPNIGDPSLAHAIFDRLFHNAYKIELRGDSMRKNQGESTASIMTDQKNAKGGKLADNTNLN